MSDPAAFNFLPYNSQLQLKTMFEKEYALTEVDANHLQIVGLSKESLASSQSKVLKATTLMIENQAILRSIDRTLCFGAIGHSINALVLFLNAYAYGSAFKNRTRENKYNVQWDSESKARNCGVCGIVFKSVSLRKTFQKHHCRACGRVICHYCGAKELFLEVSQKYERVCKSCIAVGHPPMVPILICHLFALTNKCIFLTLRLIHIIGSHKKSE